MHFPYPIIPSDYLFPFSKLHFSLSVIIFLETRIQFKIRFYSLFFFFLSRLYRIEKIRIYYRSAFDDNIILAFCFRRSFAMVNDFFSFRRKKFFDRISQISFFIYRQWDYVKFIFASAFSEINRKIIIIVDEIYIYISILQNSIEVKTSFDRCYYQHVSQLVDDNAQ